MPINSQVMVVSKLLQQRNIVPPPAAIAEHAPAWDQLTGARQFHDPTYKAAQALLLQRHLKGLSRAQLHVGDDCTSPAQNSRT